MNNLNPKVSVIITTYNRAEILSRRSLPSVLSQTYSNFEFIIVDDCSVDKTEEVIKEMNLKGAGIIYVKVNENGGLSKARNLGAKKAKGKYVVFVDDDNELFPNFLKYTVAKLDGLSNEYGAVCCGRMVYDGVIEAYSSPFSGGSFYSSIDWGWLIRRDVFDKISYDERLSGDDDTDFGIQFFSYYKSFPVDAPLQRAYSFYENNKYGDSHVMAPTRKRSIYLGAFIEKNLATFIQKSDKRELSSIYRFAGWNYILIGEKSKGIKLLKKAYNELPNLRNLLHLLVSYCGKNLYQLLLSLENRFSMIIRSKYSSKYKRYFKDIPAIKK